jgi:hypothetical protein
MDAILNFGSILDFIKILWVKHESAAADHKFDIFEGISTFDLFFFLKYQEIINNIIFVLSFRTSPFLYFLFQNGF